MYPRIVDIPLPFSIGALDSITVYSFGFMLVVAVLTAAWLTACELDRMYRQGRVGSVRVPVEEERGGRTRTRMEEASPSVLIGTIATIAVVGGVLGAKLFHILENLDQFARAPMAMIFSTGGLTFYGGLIVGGGAIAWYLKKHNIAAGDFADAVAPGLMLGYGIGRIGCYLAGDGDWGICSDLAARPEWIPTWLWSEDFSNSIITDSVIRYNEGQGDVCLPGADGVYPTMLYEFAMAAALFGILWTARKHPYRSGWLFALYLVFNGVERFLIEQIRVNNMLDFILFYATQAEVIATCTVLLGLAGLWWTWARRDLEAERQRAAEQEPTPA